MKTQEESFITSIMRTMTKSNYFWREKLVKNENLAPEWLRESVSNESTSISGGKQLGDEITSREQINGSLGIQVSDNMGLTKAKQNIINRAKRNKEAAVQCNKNDAENYIDMVESTINDDNMEAFYASIEAETTSLSHLQDIQANTVSTRTRPNEETQKELQILRDFVSKKFSLLLHPGRSGLMKDVLKHLISLPPDEGVPLRTKSVIQQLSTSFARWSLDYDNATLKLESAAAELSRAEKVKEELKANFKDYNDVKEWEKLCCTKLACLEEKKRELEEQINAIKAEIADFTAERDTVAKRKKEVFDNGRLLKAERDDLWNQVPSLKAEQEWAKITQANIEAEWSKLGDQFLEALVMKSGHTNLDNITASRKCQIWILLGPGFLEM